MAPQEPETLRFASSGCVARLGVVAHLYLCKPLVGGALPEDPFVAEGGCYRNCAQCGSTVKSVRFEATVTYWVCLGRSR